MFRHLVTGMDGYGAERTCFPDETRHGGTEHSCDKRRAQALVLYLMSSAHSSSQPRSAQPGQAKHNTAPRSSLVADCRRTRSQYQLACHGPGALWVCQCLIGSSATHHPPPDVLWWSTADPESHAPSAGQQKPGSLQGRPARPGGGEAIGGARIALAALGAQAQGQAAREAIDGSPLAFQLSGLESQFLAGSSAQQLGRRI